MITAGLRRAILAAARLPDADPLLREGGAPGCYASHLPFRMGPDPRAAAADLAARLQSEPWIRTAEVTGPGYLTVTVTREALAGEAVRIARAGAACAASGALRGRTVPAPPETDLAGEPGWPQARAALAARLTARLAGAAGATLAFSAERAGLPAPQQAFSAERAGLPARRQASRPAAGSRLPVQPPLQPPRGPVAEAMAYAGADAVRFTLARMPPGAPGPDPDPAVIARHVLGNPAYAVRYAHAAAAAVLRWGVELGISPAGFRPRLLAEQPGSEELALLDVLSWLPERVAAAARRGHPDEFAGYLEELAARTIDTMSTTGFTTISTISSERLWLADAARTGLAAGLGLLGVGAPRRL